MGKYKVYRKSYNQPEEELSWWQKPLAWANETPVVGETLRATGKVFDVINYPWEEWVAPQVMAPLTGDKGVAGNWWDYVSSGGGLNPGNWTKEREEYKEWDSPKYVKEAVEMLNPTYLIPGMAGAKLAGTAGVLGKVGKVAKGVDAVSNLPGKAASKVLNKSFDVLPKVERTLLRKTPQLAEEYIAKGTYDEAQKVFIRDYFNKTAEETVTGQVGQISAKMPPGISTRDLTDITGIVTKELDVIDPTRKLTGLQKMMGLFSKSRVERKKVEEAISKERTAVTASVNETFEKLKASGMNPTEALAEAKKLAAHELKATSMKMDITEQELLDLIPSQKEVLDIENFLGNFKYKTTSGGKVVNAPGLGVYNVYKVDDAITGFNKLLQGQPVTTYEMKLLTEALTPEFTGAAMKANMSKWARILDIANLPRAVIASFDMSAPLRQGAIITATMAGRGQFGEVGNAFKNMFKAFGTERGAVAVDDVIREGKYFAERMASPKGYHAPLNGSLNTAEEAFMSRFTKNLPFVRRSERAYVTYLNSIRDSYYTSTRNMWEGMVTKGALTRGEVDSSIDGLNLLTSAATGRGQWDAVLSGNLGPVLNATLFSPRLLISRLQWPTIMLNKSLPGAVRKEAFREFVSFMGFGVATVSMAAAAGAKIELDPRSSDFGKIKIGNSRIDIWTGYLQYARLLAQMGTNQKKTALGEITDANRADVLWRFTQSKSSPAFGLFIDILKGESYMGDDISLSSDDLSKQAKERLVPIFLQDLMDAVNDQGVLGGLIISTPSFFGAGTSTYGNTSVDARNQLSEIYGLPSNVWAKDEYNQAKETLKPYYAISDDIWGQNKELEAIYEQINTLETTNPKLAKQILYQYPQILEIRAQIAKEKKLMLMGNSEMREAFKVINR